MDLLRGLVQLILVLAVFWLPGAAVLRALRRGRLQVLAVAPAVTIGLFTAAAWVASVVHVRWNLATAAVVAVVAWGVAALVATRRGDRRRGAAVDGPSRWLRDRPVQILCGAIAVSAVAQVSPVWRTLLTRDLVPNESDPLFHLNALEWIRLNGVATPSALGRLSDPRNGSPFYPSGWHTVAAVVPVTLDNTSLLAAASYAVIVLASTAGVVLLARTILDGRGPARPALAALLLAAGVAVPLGVALQPGILPNAVGLSLVPGVLAMSVQQLREPRDSASRSSWAALVLAVLGLAACHPNAVLSVALLLIPWLWTAAAPAIRSVARWKVVVAGLAALVTAGIALEFLARSPLATTMRHSSAQDTVSVGAALWSLAVGRTGESLGYALIPTALGVAAVVRHIQRRRDLRPAVALVLVVLTYVACAVHWRPVSLFTGLFYGESRRIAPLVSIVLVVLGADALSELSNGLVRRVRLPRRVTLPAAGAAVALVPVLISAYAGIDMTSFVAARVYTQLLFVPVQPHTIVPFFTPNELLLARRLRTELPAGAVVFGSNYSGSSHLYGLEGINVVPFYGAITADLVYASDHFQDLMTDPQVCAGLRAHGVTHIYQDPYLMRGDFWPDRIVPFMHLPSSGVELLDQGGAAKVYTITGCTPH